MPLAIRRNWRSWWRACYDDGSRCAVWYHDGITYSGAEPLVNATEEFLAGLTLPDAAARFALSP